MELCVTLSVRRLVEFLMMRGSIDSRFTGFDRANEGARLHRKLQRAAAKEHTDYEAEVSLRETCSAAGIAYTLEGRADGIYTAEDGTTVIDEIKTTTLPSSEITGEQSPEHWAQAEVYAAIYARQHSVSLMRVRLRYYQVDEEQQYAFEKEFSAEELDVFLQELLSQYAPWAHRAAEWKAQSRAGLQEMPFPFPQYRQGQRAMMGEVFQVCRSGGQLLCQAPTGIGKTISVLFPALKALGDGGPVFYLTARGTTRAAAEKALDILRCRIPDRKLRSITLTAKDKICLCERRECTPEACPYAKGYYDRIRTALWDALDACALTAPVLQHYAQKHQVCPFEMGLDLSLWCDVVVGDYNYVFDPVVCLRRFFDTRGDYLFLVDEAHNLPDRARAMHSAGLSKSDFTAAKRALGKGRSRLKNALNKVNELLKDLRDQCGETPKKTLFQAEKNEALDRAFSQLCEPLEQWLEDHREPDETHGVLLQLYFDVRAWLRVAETFDDHFVLQAAAFGSDVRVTQLCLDASGFLAQDFARARAAVLFSATLAPASYYKDLCGIPQARAVMLRSPFPPDHLGLYCLPAISTRYKDRDASAPALTEALAAMVRAKPGNYLAFFPSYAYLDKLWELFCEAYPEIPVIRQQNGMDESSRQEFLEQFTPEPQHSTLGFAVMGGVFGEGVDFVGDRLIGAAIVGPGLPQVNPRQEQLRDHFEATRGCGFEYAYRFPGMNKVLQAAGRVIRTPDDKGVVLLLDDRFASPAYRSLMPPHWEGLQTLSGVEALKDALGRFWNEQSDL